MSRLLLLLVTAAATIAGAETHFGELEYREAEDEPRELSEPVEKGKKPEALTVEHVKKLFDGAKATADTSKDFLGEWRGICFQRKQSGRHLEPREQDFSPWRQQFVRHKIDKAQTPTGKATGGILEGRGVLEFQEPNASRPLDFSAERKSWAYLNKETDTDHALKTAWDNDSQLELRLGRSKGKRYLVIKERYLARSFDENNPPARKQVFLYVVEKDCLLNTK